MTHEERDCLRGTILEQWLNDVFAKLEARQRGLRCDSEANLAAGLASGSRISRGD